jgi:hypothetical protein
MRSDRVALAVVSLLLAVAPASSLLATSYVVVADAPLADEAELILTAEIAGKKVSSETGKVMTHYTVFVEDLIKGEINGTGLEVRVLGGLDESTGHFLKIWGAPSFRSGETVLLFLGENDDGSYHVMHMLLGAFHRMKAGGKSFWIRSIEDEHIAGTGPGAFSAPIETERDSELFVKWLRGRANGISQPADYYREVPEDRGFVSQFTLLADGDDPVLRWFAFEQGKTVIWKWHRAFHKGVPTRGKAQLKGALKILNNVTRRQGAALVEGSTAVAKPKIKLRYKGKTKSTTGFDSSDNKNVAYGSDIGDWIDNDFNCNSGGVLAVGGVSFIFTQRQPFRGKQAISTAETEFVVNDGTECFYQRQGGFATRVKGTEEVYLHEIMHTLGKGHACGDDESPKCSKSPVLADANMRAIVHGDGAHAMGLGRDDIMGLEFLYTNDPQAPVPSGKKVPGAKKFCKKVKGCGEGQGNCKSNKQCNGGLTCKKDVGAQFGLPPKTDVCTST